MTRNALQRRLMYPSRHRFLSRLSFAFTLFFHRTAATQGEEVKTHAFTRQSHS